MLKPKFNEVDLALLIAAIEAGLPCAYGVLETDNPTPETKFSVLGVTAGPWSVPPAYQREKHEIILYNYSTKEWEFI